MAGADHVHLRQNPDLAVAEKFVFSKLAEQVGERGIELPISELTSTALDGFCISCPGESLIEEFGLKLPVELGLGS